MLEELRQEVALANRKLGESGLAPLTWGNASGFSKEAGLFVIKPSGVPYDELTEASMVVCDLDGNRVEGDLNPSSDTPTHAVLYRDFPGIGGIVHTHSRKATVLCQMGIGLPCLGTTHADYFGGDVPAARALTPDEVNQHYEHSTGIAIVEAFQNLDALKIGAVLLHHHAPFTWGKDVGAALERAQVLEHCAEMALCQLAAGEELKPIPEHISRRHWERKHGADATYGQNKEES